MRSIWIGIGIAAAAGCAQAQDVSNAPGNFPYTAWEKRVPPYMPSQAERSGYCCAEVLTDDDGEPTGMDVGHCSEEIFRKPTQDTLSKWIFTDDAAAQLAANPASYGQLMSFRLTDGNDKCLPDPDGFLCDREGGFEKGLSYAELCRADWVS